MKKITIVIICVLMIATFSWVFPINISMADPPNVPNSPNPEDNSPNVSLTPELSWKCDDPDPGDKLFYDVYFGDTILPDKVANNISIELFSPGELTYDTTYYWKIIAWDTTNTSREGPLWNFKTITQPNQPPEVPSNPNPADDALVISVDTNLSWSCSDPDGDDLTYDVYYGTTNPPVKVNGNQSASIYNPGKMSYGTTYYWKIVAWDNHDATRAGPVWQYQTNQLPYQPSNPSPGNQAMDISIYANLAWSGNDPDGDPVTYDVYFGTVNPPPKIIDNQSATIYDPPGMLAFVTVYYWKIIAWDNHGASTDGPLWLFTTSVDTNQPPNIPSSPTPSDKYQGAPVDVNLSWIGGDPDNNPVTFDVYFGTVNPPPKIIDNQSVTYYDPPGVLAYVTIYYWKIIAWDNFSASSSGPIWNFTTKSQYNSPPYNPGSPFPNNDSSRVTLNTDLRWAGGDPDPGDVVLYDVYFGPTSPPPKKVANQTAISYDPGTMSYLTTYYWRIIAWDSSPNSSTSALFHFTTAPSSGGGGETPQEPQNIKPIADASAGEPYQGYVNATVLFDGSKSHDPDGNITNWSWNFGDSTTAKETTVFHVFVKAGIYIVTLTVTDNKGTSDTDTTTCVIRQRNRPPSIPSIQGPTSGTRNTLYTFTVASTDEDNDSLQYTFEWGESISQSSGFVPSGMNYSVNHSWANAGRYNLTIVVSDTHTNSSSKITIYIDALQTRGAGYLLDNDGDGSYDAFYSDETHRTVSVQKNGDTYLIDKDGDGAWEYVYNATYGLTSYVEPRKTPGFELVSVLSAVMVGIFLLKKRRMI